MQNYNDKTTELDLLDQMILIQDAVGELGGTAEILEKSFSKRPLSAKGLYLPSIEQQLRSLLFMAVTYSVCYLASSDAFQKSIIPHNVYVLPRLSDINRAVLIALLLESDAVGIYDPHELEVDDEEEAALEIMVSNAEKLAGKHVMLATKESQLITEKRKEVVRANFLQNMSYMAENFLKPRNKRKPYKCAESQYVDAYMEGLRDYRNVFLETFGKMNQEGKRYILNEEIVMVGYAISRAYAQRKHLGSYWMKKAKVSQRTCSLCEMCVETCPVRALALTEDLRLSVAQPFCLGCGKCVDVCPQKGLRLEEIDVAKELLLTLPEPQKEREELRRKAKDSLFNSNF